jgi:hypothetical protein
MKYWTEHVERREEIRNVQRIFIGKRQIPGLFTIFIRRKESNIKNNHREIS